LFSSSSFLLTHVLKTIYKLVTFPLQSYGYIEGELKSHKDFFFFGKYYVTMNCFRMFCWKWKLFCFLWDRPQVMSDISMGKDSKNCKLNINDLKFFEGGLKIPHNFDQRHLRTPSLRVEVTFNLDEN